MKERAIYGESRPPQLAADSHGRMQQEHPSAILCANSKAGLRPPIAYAVRRARLGPTWRRDEPAGTSWWRLGQGRFVSIPATGYARCSAQMQLHLLVDFVQSHAALVTPSS